MVTESGVTCYSTSIQFTYELYILHLDDNSEDESSVKVQVGVDR